eukprot:Gregarina_sp_Poly_1__3571@NODE_2045_length_2780_cov_14_417250_g1319_i0_p2_GENE_NODE_2045_length_2780_cov_14_417250_g1319_i0NODE_2045_length_2780_cov_14_417250_g1319_i0_p2_ORF_typecomplete_len119_score12_53DUF1726/PF08351_11/0_069DUF1726/PF08351_11/3_3e03ASFV_360/PF01671_16/0_056_NODE_2045_length_2780_cov_14_417250_g1319_i015671923
MDFERKLSLTKALRRLWEARLSSVRFWFPEPEYPTTETCTGGGGAIILLKKFSALQPLCDLPIDYFKRLNQNSSFECDRGFVNDSALHDSMSNMQSNPVMKFACKQSRNVCSHHYVSR